MTDPTPLPSDLQPWNIEPWDGTADTLDYYLIRDREDQLIAKVGRVPIAVPFNLQLIAYAPVLLLLLIRFAPLLPRWAQHVVGSVTQRLTDDWPGDPATRLASGMIPMLGRHECTDADHYRAVIPELEDDQWCSYHP